MAIQKGIITMNEWMNIHPYKKAGYIEIQYLNLAKKIFNNLLNDEVLKDMDRMILKQLSLTLTAYLEDIVSDYGLWSAFRKLHKKMYGKWLPFYNVKKEDYLFDEINMEDVKLLCWMILQGYASEEKVIHPEGLMVEHLSLSVFPVLYESFEFVPINKQLHEFFQNKENYKNFFLFRSLNSTLFMSSYLSMGIGSRCIEEVILKKSEAGVQENLIYSIIENVPFQLKKHPLPAFSHQYLAEMITGLKKECGWVRHISYAPASIFEYNGRDERNYFLTDLETGISYEVDMDSCAIDPDMKVGERIMTQLVCYRDKWMINGVYSTGNLEEAADDALAKKETMEIVRGHYDDFMKTNGNCPIAFTSSYKEAKEILRKYNQVAFIPDFPADFRSEKNYVLYAERDKGMVVALNIAEYIKHPDNPFYNKEAAENEALAILAVSRLCPKEMRTYLIENKLIPDAMLNLARGVKIAKDLVQKNMSFLSNFILGES